jgi:hypothetical protein
MRVHVGGHDVGLRPVPVDAFRRSRVARRIDHVEQFHRLVAAAQARQRDHRPQRRVRVLTAVFANAGQISLDVAGVVIHVIERRREQQHDLCVAPDQLRRDDVHRRFCAARVGVARQHGPRLGE